MINGVVKNRLSDSCERDHIIPERCYAYRKKRSTTICLNDLTQLVKHYKSLNYSIGAVSLDLDAAYDFVDLTILGVKLRSLNFLKHEVEWILEFLRERVLVIGNQERVVHSGIPQGSALSPILFNIYTSSFHELNDECTELIQYADDFLPVVFKKTKSELIQTLQNKASEFIQIANKLKLKVNPSKSAAIIFENRSRKETYVKVGGVDILCSSEIKYLGKTISCNMSSVNHYKECAKVLTNTTNLLKKITYKLSGGVHPKKNLNITKALYRSRLEYARSNTFCTAKATEHKIQSLMNEPLRISLGLTSNTAVHNIYLLAGELPPTIRALLTYYSQGSSKNILLQYARKTHNQCKWSKHQLQSSIQ